MKLYLKRPTVPCLAQLSPSLPCTNPIKLCIPICIFNSLNFILTILHKQMGLKLEAAVTQPLKIQITLNLQPIGSSLMSTF